MVPTRTRDPVPAVALLLTRLGRLHEAFLQEQCTRHDLTPADFRVLALLQLHGADHPASPTLIASWIVQTSGGLTATLRRLTEQGLVERSDDPDDGRARLVAITARGREVFEELFAETTRRYEHLTAGVDLDAVMDALAPLLAAYEHSSGRPRSASWSWGADLEALTDLTNTKEPA